MQRNFKIAVVAVIVIGLAVAGYFLIPKRPQQVQKPPIRIAFNTWIGYSSFYIAEEKGFFKNRGITVETKVIDPLAEKNAAMIRGDLDGMGGTIDSAVISAASGVKAKVVYMFDRSKGTDGILAIDSIKSIQDLKGKSVAVEEGFVGHFFLLYMLDKYGLSPSDVRIIPMTTDQAGAAFVAGKVDVAVTWEPYLSTAKQRKGSHVLVSSKELEPILADTLLISDSVLDSRSEDVKALVLSLQEANDYWLAHPDESNELVAKRWNMKTDDVKGIMSTDELYSADNELKQFGAPGQKGELHRYLSKCAELWLKAGVIKNAIDTDALINKSAIEELYRQRGLMSQGRIQRRPSNRPTERFALKAA
jgi:NitT/TauT family transport system substrate-binding protein